jgi:hypothetical protein
MQTYTTLRGCVLDLSELAGEERQFFDRCIAAYRDNTAWGTFSQLVEGLENPLLQATGGVITWAVWNHPLFTAVRDLEDRLGVRQGKLATDPRDEIGSEPLADKWLPLAEAAERKGVAVPELKRAIGRGRVIATPAQPDRRPRLVSANSLARWTPRAARPPAARKRTSQRAS